jgi:hypothetical protein
VPDSKLASIYSRLVAQARRSDQVQRWDLFRGARVAVQIVGGLRTVTFSRIGAPLGAPELDTFERHCAIPEGATRIPREGQKEIPDQDRTRYLVAYRWPETSDMFAAGEPDGHQNHHHAGG